MFQRTTKSQIIDFIEQLLSNINYKTNEELKSSLNKTYSSEVNISEILTKHQAVLTQILKK